MNKTDIISDGDIELMVRQHYALLLNNEITAEKFAHINITDHFPRIIGFWKMVMLAQPMAYIGNAFDPHVKLNLQKIHFDKWIDFLTEAVDSHFEGPHAEKVKQHAKLMAVIFQSKLGID